MLLVFFFLVFFLVFFFCDYTIQSTMLKSFGFMILFYDIEFSYMYGEIAILLAGAFLRPI